MEICETDPRSSVEAGGGAVFQRDNLFLPISSFPFFNQSVIGAIRLTHFLVWRDNIPRIPDKPSD